jgi:uncharacterized oligopeptide transporter (OPT) family protein
VAHEVVVRILNRHMVVKEQVPFPTCLAAAAAVAADVTGEN